MIIITEFVSIADSVKKVHCPVCGARLCDVKKNQKISEENFNNNSDGIIIKCYKCRNKFNILTTDL